MRCGSPLFDGPCGFWLANQRPETKSKNRAKAVPTMLRLASKGPITFHTLYYVISMGPVVTSFKSGTELHSSVSTVVPPNRDRWGVFLNATFIDIPSESGCTFLVKCIYSVVNHINQVDTSSKKHHACRRLSLPNSQLWIGFVFLKGVNIALLAVAAKHDL